MNKKLLGKWKIIDSEQWSPEMLDMDGDASIEIEKDGFGILNFCAVEADIDYRYPNDEDDKTEFSFSGNDDDDPVCGRGWLKLQGNKLKVQIYFHRGMESWFEAKRS